MRTLIAIALIAAAFVAALSKLCPKFADDTFWDEPPQTTWG